MEKPPWSVPVAVDDIPHTGLHLEIEAPAHGVRAELAKLASVRDLPQLSARSISAAAGRACRSPAR